MMIARLEENVPREKDVPFSVLHYINHALP